MSNINSLLHNKFWIMLILAIVLRLFLAFSTYHPDLQALNFAGKIIASGNVLNLYDYPSSLEEGDPLKDSQKFTYPPLIYLFWGGYHVLINFIFNSSDIDQLNLNTAANFGNLVFNVYLLILKIPYLIFDLGVGLILYKMLKSQKEKILALGLWLFNPINLYATYLMAQHDIMPTLFIVLSAYLISVSKWHKAALCIGLGIALKLFPIFLALPILIVASTHLIRLNMVFLMVTPYILSILPYLHSVNFRVYSLFASQSAKSLYAQIPVSGGQSILLFPGVLLLFYLILLELKNISKEFIWKYYLIILLLFYIFTHFHPQWLIWVTPFLILELINNGFKNWLAQLLILGSWTFSLFFFDPSLTIGLFSPLLPYLKDLPSIWVMMGISIDYNFSRSILQTIFACSAIFLIIRNFPKNVFQK